MSVIKGEQIINKFPLTLKSAHFGTAKHYRRIRRSGVVGPPDAPACGKEAAGVPLGDIWLPPHHATCHLALD